MKLKCIICERIPDHRTVHLSEILDVVYDDEVTNVFKWRIYWTKNDWGTYIADESNQVFDFWKDSEVEKKIKEMGILI